MKTLLDLEPNYWRFVCTDDFQFCGEFQHIYLLNGKMKQSSYCKQHHAECIRPLVEKKVRYHYQGARR